jgi:hypothetical protein
MFSRSHNPIAGLAGWSYSMRARFGAGERGAGIAWDLILLSYGVKSLLEDLDCLGELGEGL